MDRITENYLIDNNTSLVINNAILELAIDKTPMPLTPAEFAMMHYLLLNPATIISKREFEVKVLHLTLDRDGNVCTGSYSVYSHIASIRRKLNDIKKGAYLGNLIVTRKKLGWYLNLDFSLQGSQYKH